MSLVARFETPAGTREAPQPSSSSSFSEPWIRDALQFGIAIVSIGGVVLFALRRARKRRPHPANALPGAESMAPEQEFYCSRVASIHQMVMALGFVVAFQKRPSALAALMLVGAAAIVLEAIRRWRFPLVRVTPAEIEIRKSFRPEKLSTVELASWACTDSILLLASTAGRRIWVRIAELSADDRARLIGYLERLPLAASPNPRVSRMEIQRRFWTRMAAGVAIGVLIWALAAYKVLE